MAAKHPKFTRQNRSQIKRVGEAWRKPRGIDNKQRVMKKWAGFLPAIGYRGQKELRGTRNGKMLIVVNNEAEIAKCKAPAKCAAYIGRTVGKKKRAVLLEAAAKIGLKILNSKQKKDKSVQNVSKDN